MKFLVVGASGVLGHALIPHLAEHTIVGTTRSPRKIGALARLGAKATLCDVYEPGALERLATEERPEVVVNLLTDLAAGPGSANDRIRLEGGPIVADATRACGARRLVVESVAFELAESAANALSMLESAALASGLEVQVLRFGLLWGPGTWFDAAPRAPSVHVNEAGRRAAEIIVRGEAGTYVIG